MRQQKWSVLPLLPHFLRFFHTNVRLSRILDQIVLNSARLWSPCRKAFQERSLCKITRVFVPWISIFFSVHFSTVNPWDCSQVRGSRNPTPDELAAANPGSPYVCHATGCVTCITLKLCERESTPMNNRVGRAIRDVTRVITPWRFAQAWIKKKSNPLQKLIDYTNF